MATMTTPERKGKQLPPGGTAPEAMTHAAFGSKVPLAEPSWYQVNNNEIFSLDIPNASHPPSSRPPDT